MFISHVSRISFNIYILSHLCLKVALYSIFSLAFMFNEGSSSALIIHPIHFKIGMERPYYYYALVTQPFFLKLF